MGGRTKPTTDTFFANSHVPSDFNSKTRHHFHLLSLGPFICLCQTVLQYAHEAAVLPILQNLYNAD